MTQEGFIYRIIKALGLDVDQSTPRVMKALLTKDLDGDPCHRAFAYTSVVGMLLYLAGYSRTDIAYSVSQAARFMFSPKYSHKQALKMIGRYLIKTRDNDKGFLVLTPMRELNIEAYLNANFSGLYGYKNSLDHFCIHSRSGSVIKVASCPVL